MHIKTATDSVMMMMRRASDADIDPEKLCLCPDKEPISVLPAVVTSAPFRFKSDHCLRHPMYVPDHASHI